MGKISKEISKILQDCANGVGSFKSDIFSFKAYGDMIRIESPIEQGLYCAVRAIAICSGVEICCEPQKEIGPYRVDFLISSGARRVIVECDSQKFHERTEIERRYEKARDRFLQKTNFRIFHFTGKEILTDYFRVAGEIIAELANAKLEDIVDSSYFSY